MFKRWLLRGLLIAIGLEVVAFGLMVLAGHTNLSDGLFMQVVYRIAMGPGVIIGGPITAALNMELGGMLMTFMALTIPVYALAIAVVATLYAKMKAKHSETLQ